MKRLLSTLLLLLGIIVGANAQDMTATPLTFEAVEAGTITVNLDDGATLNAIQYNLNNNGWTDVTWNTAIELAANDVISFRGDNGTCYDDSNWKGFHFECSNDCYAYGNMMSLIDKDGFATNTELTETYAFYRLFQKSDYSANTTILNHPTYDIVLPATTLTINCYDGLFADCQGITRAPALPATELADWCYSDMFSGCTGLTAAPSLPATTMKDHCYNDMFAGCTTLTAAPALPATTLDEGCYAMMFWGCTYLEMAPALPATTLANECYVDMFHSCTTLSVAPALPATTLAEMCYANMFEGCTSLTTAPELPATSLVPGCYGMMFNNCSNLNYVKCLATDLGDDEDWSTFNWLSGVSSTGTFVKAAGADWSGQVFTEEPDEVSGIPAGWTVEDYSAFDPYSTPLTLEAIQSGAISFSNKASGPVTYRINGGEEQTIAKNAWIDIDVEAGDKVCFYGNNSSYGHTNITSSSRIGAGMDYYVYGNIMSLVDATNFATLTTLTGTYAFANLFNYDFETNDAHLKSHPTKELVLPATTLTNYCYYFMFNNRKGLTRAPELPAMTMKMDCYDGMFSGCSSLASAPELPATTLEDNCYYAMFSGCSALTTAPALPVETLDYRCYGNMFYGCTSLTTAPELPALSLEQDCYTYMFYGCTSLTSAPELPATILAESCYSHMFQGCTGLLTASDLPVTTLAQSCYSNMFNGCTSLTVAPELPATTLVGGCYNGMFAGCTSLAAAPELPATTMKSSCYSGMFRGCTGLTIAPELPATTLEINCYYEMFQNCTGLMTTPELPAETLMYQCYNSMFEGCTGLTTASAFSAKTLAEYSCQRMFYGCTSLTTAPAFPAETLGTACCNQMFYGCTSLTTAPELPAITMGSSSYYQMFYGCTSLTTAPALPATTLAYQCYRSMFEGCTGLTTASTLSATTLADYCCYRMFYGCTNLTTAPELPATTLNGYCYYEMFSGCKSLTKAPVLPAPTLAQRCYLRMFYDCTNLNYVKCLATNINATNCKNFWLSNVSPTGTFVKALGMDGWPTGTSGIPEGWTVKDDQTNVPLTLEAISDGDITFVYENPYLISLTDIEYQKNGGEWTTYTWNEAIEVVEGDKVAFRGNNETYSGSGTSVGRIVSTADVYVYGNVMSLIHAEDFATNFTLTGSSNFASLFRAGFDYTTFSTIPNTTIQNHPTKDIVLPATTLTNMCYMGMFSGCQSLTRAPELPATEMTVACYAEMFSTTGLTQAPVLPCTEMTPYSYDPETGEESGSIDCYMSMFQNCVNLTEAPALPATTLTHGVYQFMFNGCTSLTTAPELPATDLTGADMCYASMFSGCTSLTEAPVLPATTLAEDCYHRMFEGCTSLTTAPVLPAATLIGQCYGGMFDRCSNLNYVRCMATDLGENNGEMACGDWLKDVAATGTFVKAPGMDSWTVGPQEPGGLIYGIPEGWITCDKVFQTAGNWNVAANWNTGAVPAAGSDVVIAANVIVPDEYVADAGNVFVEKGNTLTIADGGQLKHSNEVQGTIQKFITGYVDVTNPGGYYLLGAPLRMDSTLAVSSGMLDLVDGHADFDTHGIDLYEFSQGLELEWKNMRWGDNLEKMGITAKGACLYARFDDATLNFSTTEYNGFVPTSVDDLILVVRSTNTPEPEFIGWNLIRNPFTCNAYLASGRDFYRMNASGDAIVLATNENDGLAIKPCEGIFVVVAAENDPDPYILPNPNTGEPITVSNLAQIRFTATEPQPNGRGMLDIKVKQEGQIADVARVRFGEGNRMGKLTLRDNATRLSIMRDSKDYSVVYEEAQGEMPLSFKAAKNGIYTLSANPESVELEYLHLIDNMTGTDVDLLAEQSYTFTSKTTDYASRFRLVFSANDASIGSASDETFAFVNDGDIIITGDIENTTVQVIDVTGRIVRTVGLLHHGSRITTVGMTPGVYVLRLINGDDVKTQKMVID